MSMNATPRRYAEQPLPQYDREIFQVPWFIRDERTGQAQRPVLAESREYNRRP
jgi:hypothetical protein